MCMMFSQCSTCSMVIYLTIQYQGECGHIEGHAYSVFFSRLPEALRGLMTKQTFRACSPSIALIKNSLNYIKTSNNRLSEKRTNHLSPIDFTNIRIKPSEKRTPHYILRSSDTDQARMDTRSATVFVIQNYL